FFLDNLIEHAIIEFGKLIENYPDSDLTIRAYDELGSAYMILGQPDQAFFVFRKAVRQFPESPQRTALEFKMGNCLEEMYRYKDALQIYRSLLDRYENRPAVEIRIAGVKERQKNRLGEPEPVDYSYRPRSRAARVEEKVAEPSAGRNKAPGGPVQIEGLHFRAKKRKTDE
ncbi:MAG: tetratricopeptide repeat protein, partial [Proteobacteria bacterium]|nr:tetratricopeptide repeat protein [Pseudomonadota bacterium]